MSRQAPIVHIGLPKTGTTSLQKHLLPKICEEKDFLYNPAEFRKIKKQRFTYSADDKARLHEVLNTRSVLVSQEGLVDWNPRNCESAADKVLDLFGPEARIIITYRDPIDYLTSLYVQKVHEGNVIAAEDFFVSSEDYENLDEFLPEKSMLRYDHDRLDYQFLEKTYKDRFSNVFPVPLSRMKTLYPFTQLIDLSDRQVEALRTLLSTAPRENRSYSQAALNLTFIRERGLNRLGLKSLGSEDYPETNAFLESTTGVPKDPNARKKTRRDPRSGRSNKGLLKPWRWWMQNVFDRIYPYKKYKLPQSVLERLDTDVMRRNAAYVAELEKSLDEKLS
ncbi:sulfotransferase [Roseivivax sp. GX 12232]|uniref:sulfotransferase n=1 Tax=Roseivivax sp. GX 12232 TaxID=2900547 RepID=UPI001E3C0F36|nr:sulfotransferase [Roseivivax sp. GX 12232]MCE0504773.1 sulfotransferase [Roseivivax sp. GX 12232]